MKNTKSAIQFKNSTLNITKTSRQTKDAMKLKY